MGTVRVQMINFGAPMVGDKHWISEFDRKIKLSTRVVNNKDLVTCLPGQNPVSGIASRIGNLVSSGSASNPYSTNVNHLLQWSNNAWRATLPAQLLPVVESMRHISIRGMYPGILCLSIN